MMRVRIETCFASTSIALLCVVFAPARARADSVGAPAAAAAIASGADNGFTQTGIASWYGGAFHGRRTASGEIFDTHQHTAAHPTLPLGSVVEITNLENGRSTVARINDRGPFIRPRIVDCSHAVASALGFTADGLANVRVRLLNSLRTHKVKSKQLDKSLAEDAAPPIAAEFAAASENAARSISGTEVTSPAVASDAKFCVQLGSFRDASNAEVLVRRASILPLPVFVHAVRTLQQVLVGPFRDVDDAAAARRDLRLAGLAGFVREAPGDLTPEGSSANSIESAAAALTSTTP